MGRPKHSHWQPRLAMLLIALSLAWPLLAQEKPPPTSLEALSVAPAAVELRAVAGQALEQEFFIVNNTAATLEFVVEPLDVEIVAHARTYHPAGKLPAGLAERVFINPAKLQVPPKERARVTVVFTVPEGTSQRAVVILFRSYVPPSEVPLEGVGINLGLGALVSFRLGDEHEIVIRSTQVDLPTETTNLTFRAELINTGKDPAVVDGIVGIMRAGQLVARTKLSNTRLLPDEVASVTGELLEPLAPGEYTAVYSLAAAGKSATKVVSFRIL